MVAKTLAQVVVVGHSNTDFVCLAERLPVPGETVVGNSFMTYAGGKAANQAVAAARAGATVQFVGCVGNDDFGHSRLEDLVNASVGVEHVLQVSDCASGIAMIIVDHDGENQIVVAPGANRFLDAEHASQVCREAPADTIISLTLESSFEVVEAIVGTLAGRLPIICNAAPFDERIRDLAPGIDYLILNEIEAAQLIEMPVTIDNGTAAIKMVRGLGFEQSIITLGEQGALLCNRDQFTAMPAIPSDVVDTTGAGDAFCGVFAAWLARGEKFESAAQAGVAAGSLAVRKHGAQTSMPERDQINAALESLKSSR